MTNPNDPAFPSATPIPKRDWHPEDVKLYEEYVNGGLTKREWFAGMAMQGILTNPVGTGKNTVQELSLIYADALIAELSKEVKA